MCSSMTRRLKALPKKAKSVLGFESGSLAQTMPSVYFLRHHHLYLKFAELLISNAITCLTYGEETNPRRTSFSKLFDMLRRKVASCAFFLQSFSVLDLSPLRYFFSFSARQRQPPGPEAVPLGPKTSPIPSLVRWNEPAVQKAKPCRKVHPKSHLCITTLTNFTKNKNWPSVSGFWPSVPMAMIHFRQPWSRKFQSPIQWACWRFPSRKPEVKSPAAPPALSVGSRIRIFNFNSSRRSCCLMPDTLSSRHRHHRRRLLQLQKCRMIRRSGASTRLSATCPTWILRLPATFSFSEVTKLTEMPSCCWPLKWWWSTWTWSSDLPWKSLIS